MKINESYKPILKNWLYGIAFYFIPFIIGYLAFSFVLYDSVLHTDVDSARYMLSALIQSEAAIVALVVTLSLVAVQLAAQSYSARVIEVFRKAPDLWILMAIYGIAIFYGLGVLKMIEKANPQLCNTDFICQSNLEEHIAFSYYLGVFAFVALVPYMWKMFEMLKPSTVINMLAEKLRKQNLLDFILSDYDENKDPILPIIDIVRSSLMKYDYDTSRKALKEIEFRITEMLKNENFETGVGEKEKDEIMYSFFDHLDRVAKQAMDKKDMETTYELAYSIKEIGKITLNKNMKNATRRAITSLKEVGILTTRKKMDSTDIISFIEEIKKLSSGQKGLGIVCLEAHESIKIINEMKN
jgi:hypothetical protein